MACRHTDVRRFDGVRCCLACGEAVFETPQHALTVQATPVETQKQYQYANLNSSLGQEIRIVVLLPDRSTAPVKCDILHVNLEDNPRFDAVSYTWATEYGDDSKSETVSLPDGATISVTANCWSVLRQLRTSKHERHLWVDALCINQINVTERNQQVGLMARIYRGAQNVIISIPDLRLEWAEVSIPRDSFKSLFAWLHGSSTTNGSELAALKYLLNSRYFQRVWTIQEVALARNVILCVNDEITELSFMVLDRIRSIQDVPAALRWNPGLASETDVLSCLRAGIETHCSDERDKVYGILSLMEPQARHFIPVDYSLDLNTIYTNALLAVIATHGTFELLTYALLEHPRLLSRDLDMPIVPLALLEMYISSERPFKHKGSPTLSAQWDDSVKAHWRPKITVRTTPILDAYVDECNDPDESIVVFENRCTLNTSCLLPRFQTRAHFIDTVSWRQRFVRSTSRRLRNLAEDMKLKNCSRFLPFFSNNPHPQSPLFELNLELHPDEKLTDNNAPGVNVQDLNKFLSTLKNSDDDRFLFSTHYSIGHARGKIQQGDSIYVLDGARAPFVLRRVGPKEYKIVTVCYLWAALELDYWNPGSKKGLWGSRHHDHACEQTQTIVIH